MLAVTAVLAVSGLAACGGSEGSGSDGKGDTASAPESQAPCTADVELTGAVRKSWSGDGYVNTGGDKQAFYKTSKGKKSVSIIPGQDDQPATPIVAAKGLTFTVQPGEGTVDVDPDGGGAKVDADAVTTTKKGKTVTVHVVADFDCS